MKTAPSARRNSFTLVEILVAVAVTGLILALLAQMTAIVSRSYRQGLSRIDNFTKSRAMLDLMTADVQRGVFRGDLPAFGSGTKYLTTNGNVFFSNKTFTNAFYTRKAGAGGASGQFRDVSLVSYALNWQNQGVDRIVLKRSDLGVPWKGGAAYISFQSDFSPLLAAGAAPGAGSSIYRNAATGVVSFRFLFRRADGQVVDPAGTPGYTGYNPANPVVAVGIGLAVVGEQSLREFAENDPRLVLLAAHLSGLTVTDAQPDIKEVWDQALTDGALADYPHELGANIRTFERWVTCAPF